MAITIGLLVTLISLSGIVLFTNIIFDGKYNLLKETICSGKYQIKDFSNIAKVNSVYSLTDESFSGTKEEYANMYIVDISPSGMDNSGSIVVFSTNDTNYFKVNNFVHKTRKNTMQKIIVKTKMVDGHKCLDY